jgi:hypothetical protein
MMGKFLVGLGSVTEGLGVLLPFIGPMAPLFTKLGGALAAVSSSVIASGGALVAALGRATAWLAGSLVAGLQVLGEYALLAGGKLLMFARTAIGVASRSLISFSATLGRAIVAMVPALVTGAVALWGFISPLLVAAAPFIAVGAAVAAAGAALWYFWDEIKELGGKLWDGIKVIPTMLWDRIKSIGSTIADIPGMIWNGVKSIGSTIADIPSMLWDGVKSIGSSIADIPSMLWNGVKSIGSSLVSLPKILFEGATDVFTGIGDAVYSVISAPFEWLSNTLDTVLAPFTSLFDVIVSPFKAFKEWLANSFIGKMLGMGDDKKEDQKKIKENETREQYIRRRSAEMIESGEVKPITDSRNGKKAATAKARLRAIKEYETQNSDKPKEGKTVYKVNGREVDEATYKKQQAAIKNISDPVSLLSPDTSKFLRDTNSKPKADIGFSENTKPSDKLSSYFNNGTNIGSPVDQNTVGVGNMLRSTQESAIDVASLKSQQEQSNNKRTTELLEELVGTSQAQLSVAAQTANATLDTSRFSRQTAMNIGATG